METESPDGVLQRVDWQTGGGGCESDGRCGQEPLAIEEPEGRMNKTDVAGREGGSGLWLGAWARDRRPKCVDEV